MGRPRLSEGHLGYPAANRGLAAARGEFLVLLNDGAVVTGGRHRIAVAGERRGVSGEVG
jgi:hypothetical protein